MASSKDYLDFVLEQLSELDEVSSRAMMGEYILYYRGKVFGGIYDDRLLVKPVPAAVMQMPDAELELPSDGAKEIFLNRNNALFRDGHKVISDGALVAITLMIAESDPKEKDIMTTMVMNLLSVG